MDFVDEQNVARFEIGQNGCKVAGARQHGAGGRAEIDLELAGNDLCQRRLAQTRRSREQHMIERLLAGARRGDENREVLARLPLSDEFREPLRTQTRFERIFRAPLSGDEPRLFLGCRCSAHVRRVCNIYRAMDRRLSRSSTSVEAPANSRTDRATASAAWLGE